MADNAIEQPHLTPNLRTGMEAIVNREFDAAIRVLASEPSTSPGFALCLGTLALAYKNLDRNDEAADCALRALIEIFRGAHAPPAAAIQFTRTLADALMSLGRPAQAVHWCRTTQEFFGGRVWGDSETAKYIDIEAGRLYGTSYCLALRELGFLREARDQCLIARDLFARQSFSDLGIAQCLANQAEIDISLGKYLQAELALLEARDHAEASNDEDQNWRILMALARIGSRAVAPESILELGNGAADAALSENRPETAARRLVMTAQILGRLGADDQGIRHLLSRARLLHEQLEPTSLLPAQSRTIEAEYYDDVGDLDEALRALLDGAGLWLSALKHQILADDVRFQGAKLHDHFRRLAKHLLDRGRIAEALVAFEVGRGLAHSFIADAASFERIVASEPFESSAASVSTSLLAGVQAHLGPNEILLSVALLPPNIVAFIVGNLHVEAVAVPLPQTQGEQSQFLSDAHAIPRRLESGVGERAIPTQIHELAGLIAPAIGGRTVASFVPHSFLHRVPWRGLLRNSGLRWDQLRGPTLFSLLTFTATPIRVHHAVSLASGGASSGDQRIDLHDEAQAFAECFSDRGRYIPSCDSVTARRCLNAQGAILISCHGDILVPRRELALQLDDGWHVLRELLPDRMNADLVILSACHSGAYEVERGDFPVGAGPELLRRGTSSCVVARFALPARFARRFVGHMGHLLVQGATVAEAYTASLQTCEESGADLWNELSCFELLAKQCHAE